MTPESHKLAYIATKATYGDPEANKRLFRLGYYADPELSDAGHRVYFSNQSKNPIIAYKGTTNLSDIAADTTILSGRYDHPDFTKSEQALEKVKSKYLAHGTPIVTGHSLGGTKAVLAARKHGGEAIVFNPGTGIYTLDASNAQVYRTDNDIISKRVYSPTTEVVKGDHQLRNFSYLDTE
jgi:hypothetical protein